MDLDIKLGQVNEIAPFIDYLTYKRPMKKPLADYSLRELAEDIPNWKTSCTSLGLDNLIANLKDHKVTYQLYPEAEEDVLKDVQLYYLSSEVGHDKPPVIICSGGYYMYLSNLNEAFPVAAVFNGLGYDCFVLNYRVAVDREVDCALSDLAAAVKAVTEYPNGSFPLSAGKGYILCGFSAGANLVALFGSKAKGYESFGLEKPAAVITAYPPVELELFPEIQKQMLMKVMFGSRLLEPFDPTPYTFPAALDNEYPDTFIVHADDDETVSIEHSIRFEDMLEEKGIRHVFLRVRAGMHGFGLGLETDAAGWVERAVNFIENK